jgi:hypothetical protein
MPVFAESVDLKAVGTIIGAIGIAIAFVVKTVLDHRARRDRPPCPWQARHVEVLGKVEEQVCRFASALDVKNPDTMLPMMYGEKGVKFEVQQVRKDIDALDRSCREFREEIREQLREARHALDALDRR